MSWSSFKSNTQINYWKQINKDLFNELYGSSQPHTQFLLKSDSPASPTLVSLLQNQLSGYLLRKFKNSNGWQKLWVVFTNFCLFFYKTHQVSVKPAVC